MTLWVTCDGLPPYVTVPRPESRAVRLWVAVSTMVPSPASAAFASRATSPPSIAVPSPPIVTWSFVVVPVTSMLPAPGSVTVRARLWIPVTAMFPAPWSLTASREGTLTVTNIGLLALRFPGVVPITSLPERTRVVTRRSRLRSAWTTTDCFAPTSTTTLLAAGQVETGEGGKRARLRRGDARAGTRRAARVVEEDPVDEQRHEDRGQQERAEGHEDTTRASRPSGPMEWSCVPCS